MAGLKMRDGLNEVGFSDCLVGGARPFADRRLNGGLGSDNMFMRPSIDASGKPFDAATVEAVWSKATPSGDHPPLRVDSYGALIWKEGYGNTNSKLGWEIGYLTPPAKGGSYELENLQPMQWENSRLNGHGGF